MVTAPIPPLVPPLTSPLPSTSPALTRERSARGASSGAAATASRLEGGATPRNMVIRSRVLLQRTPRGIQRAVPPQELLPISHLHNNSTASTGSRKCFKSTHFVGEGLQQMPVELAVLSTAVRPNRPFSKGRPKTTQIKAAGDEVRRYGHPPELTAELRQELKLRLNSLQSSCRSDFHAHPRSLRFFLKELQDICELLEAPLPERRYRRGYRGQLVHHFVRLVPQLAGGAELPPAAAELPRTGFLTVTALLALVETPWEFRYNSLTHRVCNCPTATGAAPRCLMPADEPDQRGDALQRRETYEQRSDTLRGSERHFPQRLVEQSNALRARLLDFTGQVATLLEDFMCIPEHSSKQQEGHAAQTWERYAQHLLSEVRVLDRYYTRFEELYMGLVHRMIGKALEPVQSMAGPSDVLVRGSNDPFREVHTAVICQRLGFLKQQVDFGGKHNLVHFDPGLLDKAKRVLQMDTYPVVHDMAREMLTRFDALCKVIADPRSEQLHPELRENAELREAVLGLERVWAECQFVLQQASLDFARQLVGFLPRLGEGLRWQLHAAMLGEAAGLTSEEQLLARAAFFEGLPIIVYLDELWHGVSLERGVRDLGDCCRFRELFCSKDDRHNGLHSDLAKFEDQRFARFRSFCLGEAAEDEVEGGDGRQTQYFQVVYQQLKDLAAFPCDKAPEAVLHAASAREPDSPEGSRPSTPRLEAGGGQRAPRRRGLHEAQARWLCVHRVLLAAEPGLFPSAPPPGWSTAARRHRLSVSSAVPPRMGGEAPGGHRGSSYGTPAGTHGSLVKRP